MKKIDELTRDSVTIPTRWNDKELHILIDFENRIGVSKDNTAIKMAVEIANKVLQGHFPENVVVCLTKKTKAYTKEMQKIIAKKEEKVPQ